ncbi:hypothetical protein EST38_g12098 [Candolleomyces aberdarensis]|uniref:F-box domain-containing protein n=1 Tax=Candolleomyces aberdarensis TaxID=2316362 RepID=A0A4Q2D3Z1_9AGAR|nr:hypothetical protein EST38_g12098 [Candolleomyces aberdarensis]
MSSIASDPIEPIVSDVTGPTLRPDCSADRTAGNLTLVQAVDNGDSELAKQHDVGAREQVFMSQDILPLIFLHSKELGQLDRDRDSDHERANSQELAQPYSWKASLASLIVVNKSFFHTGTNLLWDTMDSFTPVLKLLPWFSGEYKGIGVSFSTLTRTTLGLLTRTLFSQQAYEYLGSKDWDRFRVYSSRIHHLKIESTPDIVIPHDMLLQLLFLHQRPDPLFEGLHSITFSGAASQALHMLFLFVGPPLQSLEVSVATLEQQSKVLAVLPVLPKKTTSLDTFRYSGPLCREFILHVSNIKTLRLLRLKIETESRLTVSDVELLRNLPNLRKLQLELELAGLELSDDEASVTWTKIRRKPETYGWQLELSGTGWNLMCAAWAIAPSLLRCVTLQATGFANNFVISSLLSQFFASNQSLEGFSMHFGETGSLSSLSPPVKANEINATTQALKKHKNIVSFMMTDLPHFVGEFISPMLQASLPRWKRLKILHFRLHESAIVPEDGTKCFPSLTFLFTICKECPNIEELDFQFDDDQITEPANINWSRPPFPTVHPLRSLSIGTVDAYLELEMVQKAAIGAYIAGLFPRLESLTGFADETWREIEVLVKVYQVVRDWDPIDPRTPSKA